MSAIYQGTSTTVHRVCTLMVMASFINPARRLPLVMSTFIPSRSFHRFQVFFLFDRLSSGFLFSCVIFSTFP